jgi:hypothetical protein
MTKTTIDRVFLPTPHLCDCCQSPLGAVMYDAKTARGPWAVLCESCFQHLTSRRLGTGYGQKYARRLDGLFAHEKG